MLSPAELKFMEAVWANEPVKSGQLVSILGETEGWKKSTVYTFLKNLSQSGYLINRDAVVISYIERREYYHNLTVELLERYFAGDLGSFIAAYKNGVQLTREDLIDYYEKVKNYRWISVLKFYKFQL